MEGEPLGPATEALAAGARSCSPLPAAHIRSGVPTIRGAYPFGRLVSRAWTAEAIVRALRCWTEETGAPPKRDDWSATPNRARPRHPKWEREFPAWPSAAEVATHFRSWNDALAAAGLQLRQSPRWTRERIVAALREHAEKEGRSPTPQDWRRAVPGIRPGRSTVIRAFGGWRAALHSAGLA